VEGEGAVELRGIDVHVHPQTEEVIKAAGERGAQMARYFGRTDRKPVSFAEMADRYRDLGLMCCLMNSTDITTTGQIPVPNDHLAQAQKDHPDVFIAFGVVDPWMGRAAVDEVIRCHEELGVRGIGELNPGRQKFHPHDPRFYPIWEECAKRDLIVLFHTGMMGAGAGTPGGLGFELQYTKPIPGLDSLAAAIPELKLIAAHPSWPWTAESLAICTHKTNYYVDLSGWAPKYFPDELVHYVNTRIQDRALFGSDWPMIDVERWMREFDDLPIRPEVRQKIMLDNAKKLLGI
jgi:predicted TIM-barrel fold metal-dependent hydrolase